MLIGGGIYLYPGELDKPEGKLRLLYEANPLAWVVEQAGGKASTGTVRILDVEAKQIHQRVPVVIGRRTTCATQRSSSKVDVKRESLSLKWEDLGRIGFLTGIC